MILLPTDLPPPGHSTHISGTAERCADSKREDDASWDIGTTKPSKK